MFNLNPPEDDGLYITPDVGEWSKDKHYYLMRYIDAFTNSMKKKWGGLHYIDLFAGSGIERIKETGELEWGSPLIATQAPYPFTSLHLCEKDILKYEALEARLRNYDGHVQLLRGDANEKVSLVISQIPRGSLSLVFLDSYGLHFEFNTIKQLASIKADLILFFPDHLDALRNWKAYYYENNESRLDKFLGDGSDWRKSLINSPRDKYAERLRNLYEQQLRTLGYNYFSPKRICMSQGRPLYLLIFCSQHSMGLRLWEKISLKDPGGQRSFDF